MVDEEEVGGKSGVLFEVSRKECKLGTFLKSNCESAMNYLFVACWCALCLNELSLLTRAADHPA